MKQLWRKLSTRIDSRTLRERAIVFGLTAGAIIFIVFFFFLNPMYAKHQLLLRDMSGQQAKLAVIDAEIAQTLLAHSSDPDAADKRRLEQLGQDAQGVHAALTAMQSGMVQPERMTALLEQILKSHSSLRLTSMRTLGESIAAAPNAEAPVAGSAAALSAPAAAGAVAPPPVEQLLHKHGVELVVEGNYLDMHAYLNALEGMQGQLFWSSAKMQVDSYPKASLTLVVYTVNLDKKWIKL
jgi:MSHA biogenesis protein MshJ